MQTPSIKAKNYTLDKTTQIFENSALKNQNIQVLKTARDSEVYGGFNRTSYYLKCLKLIYDLGTEKISWQKFVRNNILSHFSKDKNCLDVGIGNSEHTKLLANHFEKITLIDTSREVLERVNFPSEKICGDVIDHDFGNQKFDFINLSHVLYYITEADRKTLITKLSKKLNPGGMLLVCLSESLDKQFVVETFTKKPFNIESTVFQEIQSSFSQTNITYIKEFIKTQNLNNIIDIVGLYLHDGQGQASRKNLQDFVLANYLHVDDIYEISFIQKFIVAQQN